MSTYVGLVIYICHKKGIVLGQSQSDRKVILVIVEESLREMLQNYGYGCFYYRTSQNIYSLKHCI